MSILKTSYKFWDGLPIWAKGALAVGGGVAIYFTAKSIIDRIKQDAQSKNYRTSVANAKQDLESLLRSGVKLSYSSSQYNGYVSTLIAAFSGWGTNTYQIYGVFDKMKNRADVLQLIVSYGIQTIQGGWLQEDIKTDLPGAIAEEMDSIEIWALNKILKNNNVDYQFGG
jgi:hypothetical protein